MKILYLLLIVFEASSSEQKEKHEEEARTSHKKSGIIVKGLTDVAVHFSKCCSPVPGDEIVGFVTRGRGVSIHRTDCINIMQLPDFDRQRLIEAEWQQGAADEENGGHGMIFEALDGKKYVTLHKPNRTPNERPCFFEIKEANRTIELV